MRLNPPLRRGAQVFAWLALVWLLLDGAAAPAGLAVGALAAAGGAWLSVRLGPPRAGRLMLLAVPGFAAYFIVESLRGATDVAWRALHPRLPIHPHLATYPVALPAGQSRTLLVSVVSLLPGTLCAGFSEADRSLRVHTVTPGALAGVAALESRIATLFGLSPLPAQGA